MESVARALFHGLGAVGQNFKPHECAPSQTAARPCGHRMGAHSPGRPRAAPTSQLGGRTDRPDRLGESRAEPRGWTAAAAAPRSTRAAAFRGFCCRDGRCSGRECSAPTPCNRAETSRRDHPNRSRTKPRRWGAMPTESGVHAKRGHCGHFRWIRLGSPATSSWRRREDLQPLHGERREGGSRIYVGIRAIVQKLRYHRRALNVSAELAATHSALSGRGSVFLVRSELGVLQGASATLLYPRAMSTN